LASAAFYPADRADRLTRNLSRAWTSEASGDENLIERLREHQVNNAWCGSSFVALARLRHDDLAELCPKALGGEARHGTATNTQRARLIGHEDPTYE
jgi:hypothetical protein